VTAVGQKDEEATLRIVRVIAYVMAVASVVFGALEGPDVVGQLPHLAGWWNAASIVVIFGIPLTMGLAARWIDLRLLRSLAAILAIGYLVVMVLLPVALLDGHLAVDLRAPWIFQLTVIGTSAAAIAWPHWSVWGFILLMAGLLGVERVIAYPGSITEVAAQDALQALMFNSIFAALTVVSIAAGRTLDGAASAARAETARAAAAVGLEQERSRIAALVHDGVLATLLAAARSEGVLGSALARQASATLAQLREHRDGRRIDEAVPAIAFAWRLQAITTEIAPSAEFSYRVDSESPIPAALTRAFADSMAEALRNSVRHAVQPGRSANRAVHVEIATDQVRVAVLDDGAGFDPASIAPTRLGLKVSIVARMASQPGGRATIRSEPSRGTAVLLEWQSA